VGLISLVSAQQQQLELFNQRNHDPALMNVLDNINNRYGSDTLFHASQGVNQKWAMRREFLSPQYTTNWRDIPLIHC
jgi:DNA polymerase V